MEEGMFKDMTSQEKAQSEFIVAPTRGKYTVGKLLCFVSSKSEVRVVILCHDPKYILDALVDLAGMLRLTFSTASGLVHSLDFSNGSRIYVARNQWDVIWDNLDGLCAIDRDDEGTKWATPKLAARTGFFDRFKFMDGFLGSEHWQEA